MDAVFSPSIPGIERLRQIPPAEFAAQQQELEATGIVLGCPFSTAGSEQSGFDDGVRQMSADILECVQRYFLSAIRDAVADGDMVVSDVARKADELLLSFLGVLVLSRVTNSLDSFSSFTLTWETLLSTS